MDKAEFMSGIAYLYDIICHPCTENRIILYKNVFAEVFPYEPIHILDMGCCTGETAINISDDRFQVTGIDISAGMIKEAREKNVARGKKATFELMDMKELLFKNNSFDVVYSNSLEWIDSAEDLECVIKESARCLKRGGLLLLDFPFYKNFIETCRPFYAECVPIEDGMIYKLTKYETPVIGVDLQATQTYIHISGLEQNAYTGRLKWKLHTLNEIVEITRKHNFYHTQTFYDYKNEKKGAFVQMLLLKGEE